MGLYKNVAGQKVAVYAYDTVADAPKTGDAANITAQISKDFGAAAATNDVNPTELDATDHPGIYVFDLTQAETNANNIIITPVSTTANIVLDPVQVFTVPPNFRELGIASDGDLIKVNTLDGHTAQTGDSYAIVNSGTHGNAALKTLIDNVDNFVDTEVAEILTRIGVPAVSLSADIASSALTVQQIVDGVWDEALVNHLDAGSTGEALNAAGSAGDPWTTTLPGAYTGSQAGKILADILVDTGTTLQTELDDIETDVNTILTRIGVPSVSLAADLANIDSDIAALNNFDPATEDVFLGDGAHGGTATVITFERMIGVSQTTDEACISITGNGGGAGLLSSGGTSGQGACFEAGGLGADGILTRGRGTSFSGLFATSNGSGGIGLHASATGTNGVGLKLDGNTVDIVLDNTSAPSLASVIWAGATRTLTALDEDTTTLDLDTTIRAALGLSSANLDTQLAKLDTIDDFLDTEISSILTRIGVPATSLTASIAALNNVSTAQVNAEVVDALNVDIYTEPTGIPSATASLVSKIGRLYKALMRGIEITATEKRFLDSTGTSEWKKTLSDDGTTYEETSALAP